jgi:plasmid stabilization system protein ParE
MPKLIIWSPLSVKDFENILEYLNTEWDEKVSNKFIDITDNLINQISVNPKQFPLINKNRKVRKCVITKHNTLFYRDRKDQIDILRIYDTRQSPKKLKFR